MAAQTSVRDAAAARALFQEGVECADHHDWSCAVDRFERAAALRLSPVIAYNWGNALLASGRTVEGVEILGRLERDTSAPAHMRAEARRLIAEARPRIGTLTTRLTGALQDVEVTLDGHPLPRSLWGHSASVDAGPHQIVARREQTVLSERNVQVLGGGSAEVVIDIPAPARTPVAISDGHARITEVPSAAIAPIEQSDDTGLWVGLSIGGAVLIGGAVVLAILLTQPSDPQPFSGSLGIVEVRP